jgi:hypothetical protein
MANTLVGLQIVGMAAREDTRVSSITGHPPADDSRPGSLMAWHSAPHSATSNESEWHNYRCFRDIFVVYQLTKSRSTALLVVIQSTPPSWRFMAVVGRKQAGFSSLEVWHDLRPG